MKSRELNHTHSIEPRLTEQVAHDPKVANNVIILNLIHGEEPHEN